MLSRPSNAALSAALLAATALSTPASSQTSYIAPDGRNRFPAVTIFCPSGNGVAPCVFGGGGGGGGGGGAVSINLAGGAVSPSNRFPTTDAALDALISAGALSVGGTLAVSNFPGVQAVSQSGSWMVGLGAGASVAVSALPALPAGSNAIGSVSISNLPGTQTVAGAVSQAGNWSVGLAPSASVAVSALPALPTGNNTIGAVTISGTPTFTCTGCGGSGGGGTVTQGAGAAANPWWMEGLGTAGTPTGGVLTVQGTSSGAALPVSLAALPALPTGANAIGSVSVSNLPGTQTIAGAVSQSGSWTMGLATGSSLAVSALPALPAGANAIGSVSVSNLPGTQTIAGAVSQSGSWTMGLATGSTLAVSALPALPAGANTIGAVTISGTPTFTCTGCGGSGSGTVSQGAGASSNPWWMEGLGTAGTPSGGVLSVQGVAGGTAMPVSGTLSIGNLPATQAISAASLPLPAGAATATAQAAVQTPVAPAAATATGATLLGCQAATTLPTFTAGQQGAVPCDTSGRPYVVTVPSANNVPSYLQAVTSGGASVYRAINTAASTMAASIKPTSGMVYGYEACNTGTAAVFLRLFAISAAPTVGTTTPLITKMLPAAACQTTAMSLGLVFGSGIAVDVTGGSMADSDTGTITTANQVAVQVFYK